jgi:two-component system chemotaxis response regulator CheB
VIRVAIADDSPFTCSLLTSYIEAGGDCKVVGVAHDAHSTLELIRSKTPDVLTLDLQMPGGDGLELLRQISNEPAVSVVVISGVTRLAAATTLRALELGAVDFVLKYTPGAPVSRASLRREIVTKVKIAASVQPTKRNAPVLSPVLATATAAPRTARRLPVRTGDSPDRAGVVIIGASTGGPRAIGEVLGQLAADFAVPCVIVQHLPATFTAPFAMQLARHAPFPVRVAETGDRLEPGVVLVAPGSVHLVIRSDGRIHLQQPTPRSRDSETTEPKGSSASARQVVKASSRSSAAASFEACPSGRWNAPAPITWRARNASVNSSRFGEKRDRAIPRRPTCPARRRHRVLHDRR